MGGHKEPLGGLHLPHTVSTALNTDHTMELKTYLPIQIYTRANIQNYALLFFWFTSSKIELEFEARCSFVVETSGPYLLVLIAKYSFPTQLTLFKWAFVKAAVRPRIRPNSIVVVANKLPFIRCPGRENHVALPFHLIIAPHAGINNSLAGCVRATSMSLNHSIISQLVITVVVILVRKHKFAWNESILAYTFNSCLAKQDSFFSWLYMLLLCYYRFAIIVMVKNKK